MTILNGTTVLGTTTADGTAPIIDACDHYQTYGWKEGRDPNAVFDPKGYLVACGDVRAAGIDPLMHYDQYGWKEGRDPSKGFDTTEYLAAYGDVTEARIDPMQHYLQYGALEGRTTFGDTTFGTGNVGSPPAKSVGPDSPGRSGLWRKVRDLESPPDGRSLLAGNRTSSHPVAGRDRMHSRLRSDVRWIPDRAARRRFNWAAASSMCRQAHQVLWVTTNDRESCKMRRRLLVRIC